LALTAVAAASIAGAGSAQAALTGDLVTASINGPTTSSLVESGGDFVDPTTFDFTLIDPFQLVVSDTEIAFQNLGPDTILFNTAAFEGPVITDLTHNNITNVTLDAATTVIGFDQSRISFTGNTIDLNVEGLKFLPGQDAHVDVTTAATTAVPEPASLALFGAGLLGLGFFRRRKRA
jgi:hypothetical protein